jgi:hypothetical protein
MREVEVSRFVPATLPEVERHLSPATLVEYEGTFTVADVTETDDGWTVTARATGMEVAFEFSRREDGWAYRQRGAQGPFDAMETTVSLAREDEGTRVSVWSAVSLGLPPAAITDRIAAWKRRGELRRALDRLVADLS